MDSSIAYSYHWLASRFAQVNSSFGAILRRNRFTDGLSRAGPVNSPHSIVQGNVFNGTMMGGLLLSAETTWLSGNLGIDNVTILDNVFVDVCSYTQVGYPHGQCNVSSGGRGEAMGIYNPAGSTRVVMMNNTFLDTTSSSYQ